MTIAEFEALEERWQALRDGLACMELKLGRRYARKKRLQELRAPQAILFEASELVRQAMVGLRAQEKKIQAIIREREKFYPTWSDFYSAWYDEENRLDEETKGGTNANDDH
jgi:hypothetical protein